jgi:hypothetical protein
MINLPFDPLLAAILAPLVVALAIACGLPKRFSVKLAYVGFGLPLLLALQAPCSRGVRALILTPTPSEKHTQPTTQRPLQKRAKEAHASSMAQQSLKRRSTLSRRTTELPKCTGDVTADLLVRHSRILGGCLS